MVLLFLHPDFPRLENIIQFGEFPRTTLLKQPFKSKVWKYTMVKIANQLVTFLVAPAWTILKSTIHPLFSIGNFRTNQATIYLHRNVPPRKSSGKGVPRSWRPSHDQHFAGWLEPALCWTTWRKGGSKSSPTAYRCSRALNLLLTQHLVSPLTASGPLAGTMAPTPGQPSTKHDGPTNGPSQS